MDFNKLFNCKVASVFWEDSFRYEVGDTEHNKIKIYVYENTSKSSAGVYIEKEKIEVFYALRVGAFSFYKQMNKLFEAIENHYDFVMPRIASNALPHCEYSMDSDGTINFSVTTRKTKIEPTFEELLGELVCQ